MGTQSIVQTAIRSQQRIAAPWPALGQQMQDALQEGRRRKAAAKARRAHEKEEHRVDVELS